MPPPQNLLIYEYSNEWINNRYYGTSIQYGQLADHSWHAHSMLSFLIIFDVFDQTFLLIYLFQHMYHLLKPLCSLWPVCYFHSSKYPGSIYGNINLVPSRLILCPMGSSLPICILPCIEQGALPLQLIHGVHDNKLRCFSFSKLIMVWIYYAQLTYYPHKYMKDWIWEYPSS